MKIAGQRIHAKRRAFERYGVVLNRDDLRTLVRQIQREPGRFIERRTTRITIWRVTLPDGQEAIAAYDSRRGSIATLLPPDAVLVSGPNDAALNLGVNGTY